MFVNFAIIVKAELNFLFVLVEAEKGIILFKLMSLCNRKLDIVLLMFHFNLR